MPNRDRPSGAVAGEWLSADKLLFVNNRDTGARLVTRASRGAQSRSQQCVLGRLGPWVTKSVMASRSSTAVSTSLNASANVSSGVNEADWRPGTLTCSGESFLVPSGISSGSDGNGERRWVAIYEWTGWVMPVRSALATMCGTRV